MPPRPMSGDRRPTRYMNAGQVRARYGAISDMTLWRWLRDQQLAFPQPIYMRGRRLWPEDSLSLWEENYVARQEAEPADREPAVGPRMQRREPQPETRSA